MKRQEQGPIEEPVDGLVTLPSSEIIRNRLKQECPWHDSDMYGIEKRLLTLANRKLLYLGVVAAVERQVNDFIEGKPVRFGRFVRGEIKHYYRALLVDDNDHLAVLGWHEYVNKNG